MPQDFSVCPELKNRDIIYCMLFLPARSYLDRVDDKK